MLSGAGEEIWRQGSAGAVETWLRTPRFVRNAAISLPTFLLDLALLYLLVRWGHLNYLLGTCLAFFAANLVGYFLTRHLVFAGTTRGVAAGLAYFLAVATLSAFALTPLMWLFVSVLRIEFIFSRVAGSVIVGSGAYLLNLLFNFVSPARR
jgi:putative flippase GtrA